LKDTFCLLADMQVWPSYHAFIYTLLAKTFFFPPPRLDGLWRPLRLLSRKAAGAWSWPITSI